MRPRSHPDHAPTRPRRRLAAAGALTAAAVVAGVLGAPAAQAADPVTIDLVTVNDFHGRLLQSAPSAGAASLTTAVNSIRAANPNTVFAAAGDMIGASTFESFIQDDVPTIDALNAAGLEVSAAGNHEFDRGWPDLRDRVQDLADWEYISANVWDTETGAPALAPYWTKSFGDVSVGFIGAVTEDLPELVNPDGIATLEVRDIVSSVNDAADDLTDGDTANGEADVVVLLVHEGAPDTTFESATDPGNAFGAIVTGVGDEVNAIVSGHTHLAYDHEVPYGGDTGFRPVISSGQYGEKFSDMKISVDPDTGAVLSMDNTVYDLATYANGGFPAPDPTVLGIVDAAVATAEPLGAVQLGNITADISRAKLTPATTENRGAESTLGNFVADAQLWSAQQSDSAAQIAFMNPGGLRADMVYAPDGVLTYREAANVQPFANTLVTTTLTGEQLGQVLEQQWQPAGAQRPFLKLGVSAGFGYVYDPLAAAGERITRMTLNGEDIDPAGSYRVVVNSFLAAGGDNFPAFAQGTDKRDTGKVDLESMVDYMEYLGTASPDQKQRSIGVNLSAPGPDGYEAGATIDVALSALEFSTNEVVGGTVDVSIGGVPVGSAPIDRTPVAASDAGGQASLTVTVPEGVSGVVPLTVSIASTGTSFEVPITVAAPVEPVEKVDSSTFGFPHTIIARRGATISYTAIVVAGGVLPTGEVSILDGSTVIATATLTEADNGIVTVRLPALGRGVHRLSAEYAGSDEVEGSSSRALPVLVL